ncbi:hypothetical protein ACFFJ7_11555 [Pseudochelatococcus lubricantis]|uniref:hypothetical protein n=1 Tax=Pseudochelatococcus lubricantis TaxID=1538102 RepID=UPI0035E5430A
MKSLLPAMPSGFPLLIPEEHSTTVATLEQNELHLNRHFVLSLCLCIKPIWKKAPHSRV